MVVPKDGDREGDEGLHADEVLEQAPPRTKAC